MHKMFTDRKENMEIQAHFSLLCFALLHFADSAPFYKLKICGNPASSDDGWHSQQWSIFKFNFYLIVDLQCCVIFRYIAKWISYDTYIYSSDSFPI